MPESLVSGIHHQPSSARAVRPAPKDEVRAQMRQDIKFSLHKKLIDRLNLEAMASVASDRLRQEIRPSVALLINEEKTPPPIPLPSLADVAYGTVWGAEPDENTRARLLRAALSAQGQMK